MTEPFLAYGKQVIDDSDIEAVVAALKSDYLTTGPMVDQFEKALAHKVGAAEAIVVSNGTAALHLSMMALGLDRGDAVIVPAITFAATANGAAYCGSDVIFADVDPVSGLMTPDSLAEAFSRANGRRVRAVLPVHLAGHSPNIPALADQAAEEGALLVEDACHAIGSKTPWGPVGGCQKSATAIFSFHPVKTITTGEGGAITTNNPELARRLRRLRSHGIERDPARFTRPEAHDAGEPNPWWYEQVELGYNYRLPDLLCALGLSQLKRLDVFAIKRKSLVSHYHKRLKELAHPLVSAMEPFDMHDPVQHLFAIQIDFAALGKSRRTVMNALRERGIGTQVHYIPVHKLPYYASKNGLLRLTGAETYHAKTLSLPLYPGLKLDDVDRVVEALGQVLSQS